MMPIEHRIRTPVLEIAAWEWPGTEPAVFLAHANGFHGRIWDRTIAELAGRRCIAVDLRGHGRSDKPAPPYAWRELGADLAAVGRVMGIAGALGVGHSLGGHAVAVAAALSPSMFGALLLLDPVIFAPDVYRQPALPPHFAARRRQRWASPQALRERLQGSAPFSRWRGDVLVDYCRWGLLPASDGDDWTLACPPAVEGAIYDASAAPATDIADLLPRIAVPARVIRAGRLLQSGTWDMEASPTDPRLAERLPRGVDTHLPRHTHFFPQEVPELVAGLIEQTMNDER